MSNAPICPQCGIQMRLRSGAYGDFYACPNYPKCDETADADDYGE